MITRFCYVRLEMKSTEKMIKPIILFLIYFPAFLCYPFPLYHSTSLYTTDFQCRKEVNLPCLRK